MSINQLSNAQAERLACLVEELGESIQTIGKILRHGYDSIDPRVVNSRTNRQNLERELGHVMFWLNIMSEWNDISEDNIDKWCMDKSSTAFSWTHYQRTPPDGDEYDS